MNRGYKRSHLRAPVRTSILYIDGDYTLKTQALNISLGGILLSYLPKIPDNDMLIMFIPLHIYPLFENLDEDIFDMDIPRDLIRAKAVVINKFEGVSQTDGVFINRLGCKFEEVEDKYLDTIEKYVQRYTSNLTFLISLFSKYSNDKKIMEFIRRCANFLGHRHQHITDIHKALMLDYQDAQDLFLIK